MYLRVLGRDLNIEGVNLSEAVKDWELFLFCGDSYFQ